uniref:Membrane protein n=1 Tax=uncultured bacterium contig00152 TaxID=1181591 RepID=A0A806K255_9BACT|nr:membrane protein [uncultured bacterium contig00152]
MKFPHIAILLGMVSVAAFASTDSLRTQLDSITALDHSTPGVLITGEFRSGFLSSVLTKDEETHTGINAATEADIIIQARPSKETRATVFFRVHQDWQKSHEEGISPVFLDWISYDGKILGGHVDFNLGDMRVAYTPLTIYTPLLNIQNEAEIFALRRKDAMAYKHLYDDGNRLLQGLNVKMNSGEVFIFDDLYLQGTVSRLRNSPRKYDMYFFDYDDTDRILFAGRGGFGLFGITLGANYVYAFTREEALNNILEGDQGRVSVDPQLDMQEEKPFLIEDVKVISGTLGIDIARLAGLNGWKIDLGAEYAISNYKTEEFYSESRRENSEELEGTAMLASLNVYTPALANTVNIGLNLSLIKNDEKFVSELAQNPVYYAPANVLNSNALNLIRGSTLENLYFVNYTNDPLTQYNLTGASDSPYPNKREHLNNNKKAHFMHSGYSNNLKTPSELRNLFLDPGVNMSLPFGLATPNRQGVLLKLETSLFGDKLGLNAFANQIYQNEIENGEPLASYLDAGGGFAVEIGKFIGLSQTIRLNAGGALTKETDGWERSVNRVSGGLRVGILRWLSILGGAELIDKDYGSMPIEIKTGKELLWLAGPEIELSRGSYFNLQFGMLNYEFTDGNDELKTIDRTLISADVRVKF